MTTAKIIAGNKVNKGYPSKWFPSAVIFAALVRPCLDG